MIKLLLKWAASAAALYVVTLVIPGVHVGSVTAALIAAIVIGLVNATLGSLLKMLTLPIGCLTLGISGLLINGLMFLLAAKIVDGFHVTGFLPAFLGSVVMAGVNWAFDAVIDSILSSDKSSN